MNETRTSSRSIPSLSVVVVSFNGENLLAKCLASLASQQGADQIEIHVLSKEPRTPQSGSTPCIQWHQVDATTTIPAMRTAGVAKSTSNLVALLEDDCQVGPDWLQSILSAHQSEHPAIGGAIEPGDFKRGLDWGVFYCEFARFLSPFSGNVRALPGNNVSYKRQAIDQLHISEGFYDVFIHEQLQNSGTELIAHQDMVVRNTNTWTLEGCTLTPFHHGRAYAGQRFGPRFNFRRLLYGLLAPLLPVVKSVRTLREVRSRGRDDLPLVKPLPWILLFQSSWSAGEFVGYLAGSGDSIKKWQ